MITFFEQIVSAFKFIRIQDYIDIFWLLPSAFIRA